MKTLEQPKSIGFEVTNRCNMKCVYCARRYFNDDNIGDMDLNLIKKVIDAFDKTEIISLNLYGEPFLYPHLFEAIEYSKSKDKFTLTTTNGLLLTEDVARKLCELRLDRIIISIDTIFPDEFKAITGRTENCFHLIMENIEKLYSMESRPQIYISIVECDENRNNINETKFELCQVCDGLGSTKEKFSLPLKNNIYINSEHVECERPFKSLIVRHNGMLSLCCRDAFNAYNHGLILKKDTSEDIRNLWHESFIEHCRYTLNTGENVPMLCKLCKMEANKINR